MAKSLRREDKTVIVIVVAFLGLSLKCDYLYRYWISARISIILMAARPRNIHTCSSEPVSDLLSVNHRRKQLDLSEDYGEVRAKDTINGAFHSSIDPSQEKLEGPRTGSSPCFYIEVS